MNSTHTKQNIIALFSGLIFAIGLAIAGMTEPQKIIGFLDPWNWDPSLIFVMIGAVGLHFVTYRWTQKKSSPLFDTKWHIPTRKDLNARLVLGSALFGIGWGLGGYCPGPGLTSLFAPDVRPIIFVASMILGMFLFKKLEPYLRLRE